MNLRNEYSKAKNTTETIRKYPKSYFPQPTDEDYRIGYIERYFAKPRANIKGVIIEINKDEYENLTGIFSTPTSLHYNAIKLRWVIQGTFEEIQRSNSNTLIYHEKNMPGISLHLGNLLQFWQS
jgi:hypothetical protein